MANQNKQIQLSEQEKRERERRIARILMNVKARLNKK